MNNISIVERIIRSLSFEVEAIPQDTIETSSSSKTTPVNIKIRVRKKSEALLQEGVMTIPKHMNTDKNPQLVQLVGSNQTIMSFNVFVESEKDKIHPKKPKKHIFNVLKPGLCLSNIKDEDDYQYVPSQPPITNTPNTSIDSQSESVLRQHFSLREGNLGNIDEASTLPRREIYFLGKCKPGGCLDPPFGEDIYVYKPTAKSKSPLKHGEIHKNLNMKESVSSKRSSISGRSYLKNYINQNKESLSTNKTSKVADFNGVFKLYQTDSMKTFLSTTQSNSIITYPPTVNASFERVQENKNNKRKTLSEDLSKKSFNEFTEIFFHPKHEIENAVFPDSETREDCNDNNIDSGTISDKKSIGIDDIQEKCELKYQFSQINIITEATTIKASTQDNVAKSLKESQNNFIKGFEHFDIQTANCINKLSDSLEQNTLQMIIDNKIVNSSNFLLKQDSNVKILKSQEKSLLSEKPNRKDIDSNGHLVQLNSSKTNIEKDNKANVDSSNLPQQSIQLSSDNSDKKFITKSETNQSKELKRISTLKNNQNLQENKKNYDVNSVCDNNENNSEIKLSDTHQIYETYSILDKKESPLILVENSLHILNYEIKESYQKLSQVISIEDQDLKRDITIKNYSSYSCDTLKNKTLSLVETVTVSYKKKMESNFHDNISYVLESDKKHSIKNILTENCPPTYGSLTLKQRIKSNLSIKEYENKPSETKLLEFGKNDNTDLKQSQSNHKKDKYETNIYENTSMVGFAITETDSKNKTIYIKEKDIEETNSHTDHEVRDPTNLSNNAVGRTNYIDYIKISELNMNINKKTSSATIQEKKPGIDQGDIQMRGEIASVHQNIIRTDEIIASIGENYTSIQKFTSIPDVNSCIEYDITDIMDRSPISTDDRILFLESKYSTTENRGIEISQINKKTNQKGGLVKTNSSTKHHRDSKIYDSVYSTDMNKNASVEQSIKSESNISDHTYNIHSYSTIQKKLNISIKSDSMVDEAFINVKENTSIIMNKPSIIETEIGEIFSSETLKKNINTAKELSNKDQTDTKNENASSNNEYYTHDDKEKYSIFSDKLTKTIYDNENLKNITEIASYGTNNFSNKDKYTTKIIKDKTSKNNLNAMYTNETVSEKQSSQENISVEVSKNIYEAKLTESYDILNQANYSSSRHTLATDEFSNPNSVSQCLSEKTQVSSSQKLENMSFSNDYTIERKNIFNELKAQDKERSSFITDSKVKIYYNSDSFHEKQTLNNQEKINNELKNMVLPTKPSLTSQPKGHIIPNISFSKLSSNVSGNNFNVFDKYEKVEFKSYFEPSEDNNYSNNLIKPTIQDISRLQAMTVKEKIKNFTKYFSVGASIPPINTVNNTESLISVNFGFQSYINDNNERIFKTIDVDKEAERFPGDIVTIVKSLIRLRSKEIRIPIDEDIDISFNIINPNFSTHYSSDIVNDGRKFKIDLHNKQKAEAVNNSIKDFQYVTKNETSDNKVIDDNVISIYEKELVPLRKVFKDLKVEIDSLARQKPIFRDRLQGVAKYKPKRLISVNRRCGCLKE